ncbi:MAG: hypothetical protein HC836_31220 [Richelia sp. RM2_1_2]|nr:hypothetical protein [Richelia sp. RM2_1_2]
MDDTAYANIGAAQTAINDGTVRGQTAEIYDLELTRLAYVIIDGAGTTATTDDVIASITISKEVLGSQILSGGGGGTASSVSVNVANFDDILTSGDTTVQLALDRLDDHLIDDHQGVDTSSKVTGSMLQWNGTLWVDVEPINLGIGSYNTITADSGSATTTVGNATLNFTGGEGITTSVSDGAPDAVTIELALNELPTEISIQAGDLVPFVDISAANADKKATWTSIITGLDLVTASFGSGMIAKTADDTYAGRTITASAVNGLLGVDIVNGDGVAGNPTIGLNVTGLTALSGANAIATGDELAIYDLSVTTNKKVTVGSLFDPAQNPVLAASNQFISADATPTTTYVHTALETGSVVVYAAGDKVAEFTSPGGAGDSHFEFDTGTAGEVRIEANGAPADIDIRLVPKGNGDVIIGDAGAGVIEADTDQDLTVSGGDGVSAGDLILEGGDGSTTNGAVIIRPGQGAGTDSNVCVFDSNGVKITCFEGTVGADTSLVVTNGNDKVTISNTGSTNGDIVLDPAGTGQVVLPSGYAFVSGQSLVTKAYVDSQIATTTDELVLRATLNQTGGAIGTMPNVAGKTYFVDRVVVTVASVTGTWSAGGDIAGTLTYATGASDIDYNVPGTYVIDAALNATDEGGAAFTMSALTGISATSVIVVVHYKAKS